jgi:predicted alpha/beta hydrolase family esterase
MLLAGRVKAVLLHGTDGTHESNWLPWLQTELERNGWQVWNPDLPDAGRPSRKTHDAFLQAAAPFALDGHTVVVGHSAGALAALSWLQTLRSTSIARAVLVGAFKDDLGWDALVGLFDQPYDWPHISTRAERFTLFHSDNDPYCPLHHAEFLAEQLGGELRVLPGRAHFNLETNPPQTTFPELLQLLRGDG